ncbi:hypothetical protein LP43_2083 [Methylophaga thiooxydans]|uniref:Uncharacterized protein n=1 Tax=Methylophaga thiooxydans TaxID=392484 RepID=A0A0A0BED9_9GAMM|nr:hypothetical protein LP43_2083 [Methylophaga thiooxydans]
MKKPRRNANSTHALKKYPHFKNGVKKACFTLMVFIFPC